MLFQTHKIFIHLWYTNEGVFNDSWEISVPPLLVHATKIKLKFMKSLLKKSYASSGLIQDLADLFIYLLTDILVVWNLLWWAHQQ